MQSYEGHASSLMSTRASFHYSKPAVQPKGVSHWCFSSLFCRSHFFFIQILLSEQTFFSFFFYDKHTVSDKFYSGRPNVIMGSAFLFLIWQDKSHNTWRVCILYDINLKCNRKRHLKTKRTFSKLRYWALTLRGQFFFFPYNFLYI